MEENQIGLVPNVECKFFKTDATHIAAIAKRRGIPEDKIRCKMRYNIFTVNQFADITGLSVSNILNKTRPSVIAGQIGTELNFCYPFQDENSTGPKFIFRDKKAEQFIKV